MSNHQPNQTRRDEAPKDERKKKKKDQRQPSRPRAAGQGQESQREKQGQGKRKEKGTRGETRRGGDLLHEEHAEYDSTTNSNKKTADETAVKENIMSLESDSERKSGSEDPNQPDYEESTNDEESEDDDAEAGNKTAAPRQPGKELTAAPAKTNAPKTMEKRTALDEESEDDVSEAGAGNNTAARRQPGKEYCGTGEDNRPESDGKTEGALRKGDATIPQPTGQGNGCTGWRR